MALHPTPTARRSAAGTARRDGRRSRPGPSSPPAPPPARWPTGSRPGAGRSPPPPGVAASSSTKSGPTAWARSTNSTTASLAPPCPRPADRQRPQRPQTAPREPQALPAGGQDPHPRRPGQDRLGQLGGRVEQMLTVVQHHQQLAGAQEIDDRLRQRVICWPLHHPQRRRRPPGPTRRRWPRRPARTATRRPRTPGPDSAATCNARRVLPTPPTPVKVTSRDAPSSLATAASSASRPTNELASDGRFPGSTSNDRNGSNPSRRPPGTPASAGPGPAADARPDPPAPPRRPPAPPSLPSTTPARRGRPPSTGPPGSPPCRNSPRPARSASPVCNPIRTRIGVAVGHGSAVSNRWASTAAATAADRPSERHRRTRPHRSRTRTRRAPATADRSSSSWRAKRGAHRRLVLLPQARRPLDVGEQKRHGPRRHGHAASSHGGFADRPESARSCNPPACTASNCRA